VLCGASRTLLRRNGLDNDPATVRLVQRFVGAFERMLHQRFDCRFIQIRRVFKNDVTDCIAAPFQQLLWVGKTDSMEEKKGFWRNFRKKAD
jgi:hypothetical protein